MIFKCLYFSLQEKSVIDELTVFSLQLLIIFVQLNHWIFDLSIFSSHQFALLTCLLNFAFGLIQPDFYIFSLLLQPINHHFEELVIFKRMVQFLSILGQLVEQNLLFVFNYLDDVLHLLVVIVGDLDQNIVNDLNRTFPYDGFYLFFIQMLLKKDILQFEEQQRVVILRTH